MDREVLEEGADHGVTNHDRRDLERLQLECSQSRALVVRGGLRKVGFVELSNFMQVCDKTQGSSVALRRSVSWFGGICL